MRSSLAVQDDVLEWAQGLEPLSGKEFDIPDLPGEQPRFWAHGFSIKCQHLMQSSLRNSEVFLMGTESRLAIRPCAPVAQPEIAPEAYQPTSQQDQERFSEQVSKAVSNSSGYESNPISTSSPQLSSTHGHAAPSSAPLQSNKSLLQPYVMPPCNSFYHNANLNAPISPHYVMSQGQNIYHNANQHLFGTDGINPKEGRSSQIQELNPKQSIFFASPNKKRKEFMQDIHMLKLKMDLLQKGVSDHMGEEVHILECPHCNLIFLNNQTFGGHMSKHSKNKTKLEFAKEDEEARPADAQAGEKYYLRNRKGKGKLI